MRSWAVASASSWARWASQAALKAARASLGATPMRAAMSQKARRTSFAFRAFCTSQEMTRSLSSRKVLRTISVADWNFVQNPLRWSLVG